MTNKPAPKLIRVEPNKIWYLTTYYFECVECGSEFCRHRFDSRTNPYCGMCQRKHDAEAQRERNILKSAETEYWKRVAKSYERKIEELEGTKEMDREIDFEDEYEIYEAMQDKEFLRKTYGNTDVESILKKNYRFDIQEDWREWKETNNVGIV